MFELIYPDELAPLIPAADSSTAWARVSGQPGGVPDVSCGPHSGRPEYFPVIAPNGVVIGRASRSYCHSGAESIMEALYRESSEELGFREYNPVWLRSYEFESEVEKELVNVFAAVGTFSLHPDLDEVDEVRGWTMQEIDENLGKSLFTPNFEGEFMKIRENLLSLL